MHDTNEEITMPFQKLDVYVAARELAVGVQRAKVKDAELRDQMGRASKSCFLNLSEGFTGDSVAMRGKFFSCAGGSAAEVAAAVDLAEALGFVEVGPALEIRALAVRIKKMLRRLR